MANPAEIEDVSDTALWVAHYRATESQRPDALFRDDLAALLVGERGRQIESQMPHQRLMGWVMVVRTVAIDRLILSAVAQGVDTVINLGAGLDTRPYRMKELPSSLRWIEVDFPHMIELKNLKLGAQTPICKLERLAVNLADPAARHELFAKLGARSQKALIITEGVIPYLSTDDARALAQDLARESSFQFWIQDYYESIGRGRLPQGWRRKLRAAPFLFRPSTGWLAFFAALGWSEHERIGVGDEAERIGRRPPVALPLRLPLRLFWKLAPRRLRDRIARNTGYVLLKRS